MGSCRGECSLGKRQTLTAARILMADKGGIRIERRGVYPAEMPPQENLRGWFVPRGRWDPIPSYLYFEVIGHKGDQMADADPVITPHESTAGGG